MAGSKIKAHIMILKNISKINQRYSEIQKSRIMDDKTIIQGFSDELMVPRWVSNDFSSKMFNSFIKNLSKITKSII
jgi:hypothetical protein